jgi:starch phosphorylase
VASHFPPELRRLPELVRNLWWSWRPEARALFKSLDYPLWKQAAHNPVRLLREVPRERLEEAARDPEFLRRYRQVLVAFDEAMSGRRTWFHERYPALADPLVAYFSAEYGLHNSLPFYAGGLGILAGDLAKEASDLGVPLVGVGFMYPQGYFHQRLNADGWQEAVYQQIERDLIPVEPAHTPENQHCTIALPLPDRQLHVAVWQVKVGRTTLYLMDTDLDANAPWDRELTGRLYGGGEEVRFLQEMVLGIGGVRVLRALGVTPRAWHANEGHAALMMVERLRELIESGLDFERAAEEVSATTVFTTHTPVPAGHDAFPFELVQKYLLEPGGYWPDNSHRDRLLALAAQNGHWGPAFNMTTLALRLSGHRNAVSRQHCRVTRRMWNGLWPEVSEEAVPITAITNGVHVPTWVAAEMDRLYQRHLAPDWVSRHDDPALWNRVTEIPDDALWKVRCQLKAKLVRFVKDRARHRWSEGAAGWGQVVALGALLDPDALTIGFARRFASYKRATLVLKDLKRLKTILTDPRRPVQIVFAGKAHPADDPGKHLLQAIYAAARDPELAGRIALVEDYDMHVARYIVQGVDLWLNTPRPPMEASGTSGIKAALNGVPSLSVLDGWWLEGYDGSNGWAIGEAEEPLLDPEASDLRHAEELYQLLETRIVPTYYDRGPDGAPGRWLKVVRRAIQTLAPTFSSRRMLKQYVEQLYATAMTGTPRSS